MKLGMKHLLLSLLIAVSFMNLASSIAHAACPAAPVGSAQDRVIQMVAGGDGMVRMGSDAQVDATEEGAVVYDAANNTIAVCDGTNWTTLGSGGGGSGGDVFRAANMGRLSQLVSLRYVEWAHGQGSAPHTFGARVICETSTCSGGYQTGDAIWIGGAIESNEMAAGANATHVFVARRTEISIPIKAGGNFTLVTNSPDFALELWGVWHSNANIETVFVCPGEELNGLCYTFHTVARTYNQANADCHSLGGMLANVKSAAIETILDNLHGPYSSSSHVWIGGTDAVTEGAWLYADGMPFSYTNWHGGEPNNHGGNEDCAVKTNTSGQWNDATCTGSFWYWCERPM